MTCSALVPPERRQEYAKMIETLRDGETIMDRAQELREAETRVVRALGSSSGWEGSLCAEKSRVFLFGPKVSKAHRSKSSSNVPSTIDDYNCS